MSLDFAKMCGKHSAVYEAYYKQIDPKGSGAIEAMVAAKFLKKSGLSDVVLSRVWDMSDPNGRGFLDKPGFFVALKLVSLAQAGQVFNINNIYTETANPPKVGELPKTLPLQRIQTVPVSSGGVANGDWSISVIDRLKYEQLFEASKPNNGMLPGNKVKGILMDSKLPMETLGAIWDLADQDKDGNLDKHEFIVAMHLVYQTLQKRTIPNILPPELRKPHSAAPPPKPAPPVTATMPRAPSGEGFGDNGFVANFPKDIAPPPVIPPLPIAVPPMTRIPPVGAVGTQSLITTDPLIPIGAPPSVTANAEWVVTAEDLKRFEVLFHESDRDKDGLVSGLEVKNVFLQSGVPQKCLAHIWALCDTNQSGKLTIEQFALAMWMVERKQKGIEPPQVLTSEMVPPSMHGIVSGVDLQPQEPKPTYSNPELEMISKEIDELARERRVLETEIAQKEADIRIKTGEVRSLQNELDTLSSTLKQLENQRGEAQKRLDDLKTQVNKIRDQCQKQEDTINEQEGELNAKRSELQKLKDEEMALQKEYDDNNRELLKLTQHLQSTQLQISSVRSMVTQLMETQRQMTDALLICRAAIDNQNAELVSEYQLKIEADFDDARKTLEKQIEEPKTVDPFGADSAVAAKTSNGFATNGFENDPFVGGGNSNVRNPNSGFDESFSVTSGFDSGFDAFGNSIAFGQQHTKDPFGADAFGGSVNVQNAITPEPGKDDFGSDPFAALHAPTGQGQILSPNTQKSGPPPRPESPSPALPPKKSKVPPPRPAPPRPAQGPPRPTQPTADSFGSTATGSGFADFADFDNKFSMNQTSNSPSLIALPICQISPVNTTSIMAAAETSKSTLASTPTKDLFDTSLSSLFAITTTNSVSTSSSPSFTFALLPSSATTTTTAATSTTTTTSTAISLATTITTNSINIENNYLTRSTTPLQQSASVFDTIPTPIVDNHNSSVLSIGTTTTTTTAVKLAATTNKATISGPTDFKDDPFKDYRYEDPFNIKDPFADDDDDECIFPDPSKVFKDDFSTDDEQSINGKDDKLSSAFGTNATAASTKSLSIEFLDSFDAFNINSSPAPSQHSTASTGAVVINQNNINKSKSNTPIPAGGGGSGGDNAAVTEALAAYGAVRTTLLELSSNGLTQTTDQSVANNNIKSNTDNTNENDSFLDAFINNTDEFNSNSKKQQNTNGTPTALASAANAFDPFDAFTVPVPTKSKTTSNINTDAAKFFDVFNDNAFQDDFFKATNPNLTQKDNNLNLKHNNKAFGNDKIQMDDSFEKLDAFADFNNFSNFPNVLNNSNDLFDNDSPTMPTSTATTTMAAFKKVQNQTTQLTKTPNQAATTGKLTKNGSEQQQHGAKIPEKFAADYSDPDTIEADLQEALKRSMLDH